MISEQTHMSWLDARFRRLAEFSNDIDESLRTIKVVDSGLWKVIRVPRKSTGWLMMVQ